MQNGRFMIAVCALVERKSRFLACRRPHGTKFPGCLELPTGVLEDDETLEDCLERTCFETLSRLPKRYKLVKVFDSPDDPNCRMFVYRTDLCNNFITLERYFSFKWLKNNKIPKIRITRSCVMAVK